VEATFEEKEYESAALGELMRPSERPLSVAFSAGQVLETIVGYDAVANPDVDHVIWRILRTPRPSGLRLLPSYWPGRQPPSVRLPSTPISLVLQFKRPEYMLGATALQWKLWGRPYYRFERRLPQQRVLARLEQTVGPAAIVRYASPAFWERSELEAAHIGSAVLARSGFVSPSSLTGHRWWTYDGPGTYGRANRDGDFAPFERFDELIATAFDRVSSAPTDLVPRDALGEHVLRVGAAAAEAAPPSIRRQVRRWESALGRYADLPVETIRRLGAFAMTSTVTARADATWLIIS
jgi:hypothetical protein